ncbi:MAG: carbohydrate-binding domain-containing protein [Eubacteriales bacterium]|nr:carbohydrate-binding domain-containing protein [Eubacteriales bacterium]
MNLKRVITVITAAAIISASLVGCSADSSAVDAGAEKTSAISQEESTANKADADTDNPSENTLVAEKEESTTAKGETTSSSAKSTTAKKGTTQTTTNKTTTKKSSSKTTTKKTTTKKNGSKTTTKKTTTKKSGSKTTTKKTTTKKTTTKKSNAASTTVATKNNTTTAPASTEIKINLTKNGNAECKSSNVTISPASSKNNYQGTVYIEKGGDYIITSSVDAWHGQIVINLANTESANIRIENVNITSTKANVIKILDRNITTERSFIEADASSGTAGGDTDNALRDEMKEVSKNDKAPNVDLSFPTGTSSSFSTSANSLSGVIYNESKLTLKGNGKVNVSATNNRNNAICSTKSITFKNVTANLSTAANSSPSALSSARGIFTFSKVYVESGTLNIKSNGDGIRCEEFNSSGGKTDITSSAADGIDADDAINITGGNVTVKGLEKSCFKVRRINNQEKIDAGDKTIKASDGVTKSTHTFKIDGGTVIAVGKNVTTVQKASKQASITCRSVKFEGTEEAKKAIKFTIKGTGVNVTSPSECIKYLYSSPSIDKTKEYTASSSGYASKKVTFDGTVGDVRIEANK